MKLTAYYVIPEVKTDLVRDDKDNQDGLRPESVKADLVYEDISHVLSSVTLSDSNSWNGTFTNVPESFGYPLTVKQDFSTPADGPGTYASSIIGDQTEGFMITNTHTPETIDVAVEKVWEDNSNEDKIRPSSVEVVLYANGEEADTLTLTEASSWKGVFKDVPAYDGNRKITYTVKETLTSTITGTDGQKTYSVTVSDDAEKGFLITNTHTPKDGSAGKKACQKDLSLSKDRCRIKKKNYF